MDDRTVVAVLVGSLRKESLTRKLANAFIAQAPPSLDCRLVEIGDLPLYNEDLEADAPASWSRFRADIAAAGAVLFFTPEYNRSIPGGLKNALDVGSRPQGKNVFAGRPAAVVGVTPYKMGAFGANHALRQSLVFLDMPVLQQPEAYIGGAGDLFAGSDGHLESDDMRAFIDKFLAAFAGWIRRLGADRPDDFGAFMKKRQQAANAYVNGDAGPVDGIAARAGAATFYPPNGGYEEGAAAVATRYAGDAKMFTTGGHSTFEILHSGASGDVAFWTGFQRAEVRMQGKPEPVAMTLRVTELFRHIDGEWKLVHRHADPLADKQPPPRRP